MAKSNFVFGATPTVSMRRSKFDLSHGVKTSMSVGELCPIDVTEVIPGDTFKCKLSDVVRLSTSFLRPVMDNVFMDVYYFFVPSRLLYDRNAEVFGENNQSPYAAERPLPEYPSTLNRSAISSKSVGDYLGLPLGQIPPGLNVMPFRGFAMIYNEWFRNENTVDPVHVQTGDFNNEYPNSDPWGPSNYMGKLPKVGKKKDYFTSCLPSPQKGDPVTIGAVVLPATSAPVVTGSEHTLDPDAPALGLTARGVYLNTIPRVLGAVRSGSVDGPGGKLVGVSTPASISDAGATFAPNNLYADIPETALNAVNVNDLRVAFALQKMLEKDSRYGTRYREYLLGHFGVSNSDARMQVPEFLGGNRLPLNIQAVPSTNASPDIGASSNPPLATLGAYSHTTDKNHARYTKSFTEHGYVFTVACIRQLHTYQQGVDRLWFRRKREDFYDPLFANLGEQPVFSAELYANGEDMNIKLGDGNVFGYNEAWADYRYKPSKITGQMRTPPSGSLTIPTLDIYHFGDFYKQTPVLTSEFTNETASFFDRTLAVASEDQDNFIVDFWFDFVAYRVMPTYSKPGLIDHH